MRMFKCSNGGAEVCWPVDTPDEPNSPNLGDGSEPLGLSNDMVLDLGPPWKPMM